MENESKKEDAGIKNFLAHVFRNFHSNHPLKEMKKIQDDLSKQIVAEDVNDCSGMIICGADVAYKKICDDEYGFGVLTVADKK